MNNQEIDEMIQSFHNQAVNSENNEYRYFLMMQASMQLLGEIAKRMPEPVKLRYEDPT